MDSTFLEPHRIKAEFQSLFLERGGRCHAILWHRVGRYVMSFPLLKGQLKDTPELKLSGHEIPSLVRGLTRF